MTKTSFSVEKIRKDFSILKEKMNGKPLIYVDNAATTQKPNCVIKKIEEYYKTHNSNVHRGAHTLAELATDEYEKTRSTIAKFLNTQTNEIVYTYGATHSLNLVAFGLNLKKGDQVIISECEHHANLVPWQELKNRVGIIIKYCKIKKNGELDFKHFQSLLSKKTKVVSLTHASNVIGIINPIKKFIKEAKKFNAITIVDASQSVLHTIVDVKKLECDFLVFSAHKVFSPTGVGFLYGASKTLSSLHPLLVGGGMIESVSTKKSIYSKAPHGLEAGTPNISGIVATNTAFEYLDNLGWEYIHGHEQELTKYFTSKVKNLSKNFKFIGSNSHKNKISLFSFYHTKIDATDIITFLDEMGIAARGGHHCAEPLHNLYGVTGSVRISLTIYNTKKEIDFIIKTLEKIEKVFLN